MLTYYTLCTLHYFNLILFLLIIVLFPCSKLKHLMLQVTLTVMFIISAYSKPSLLVGTATVVPSWIWRLLWTRFWPRLQTRIWTGFWTRICSSIWTSTTSTAVLWINYWLRHTETDKWTLNRGHVNQFFCFNWPVLLIKVVKFTFLLNFSLFLPNGPVSKG